MKNNVAYYEKKKIKIVSILVSVYVAVLFWVTLCNRTPVFSIHVLFPFQSYLAIFQGNIMVLFENLGNMALFVPFGFFIRMIGQQNRAKAVTAGFFASLVIEILQLITTVGYFEFDDLLHNTTGTLLGWYLWNWLSIDVELDYSIFSRYGLIAFFGTLVVFAAFDNGFNSLHYQRMVRYAALSDTQEHSNMLILNGRDGYCSNTDVFVKYQKDGSIRITGTSNKRAWYLIGEIILGPNSYVFSGLSGVGKETVAIELEYYNAKQHQYIRLTPDIGPIDEVLFSLDETTKVRVYVGVYEGCDCDVIARPVIYIEE